jgi:hypothetical protein
MEMSMDSSELDELTQWDGLADQLRTSTLGQGRPSTSPPPPPVPTPPHPAPARRSAPQQPPHWSWPWARPVFIDLIDDDDDNK